MDAAGRIGIKAGVVGAHQHNLFDDVAPDWVEVDVKNVTVEHNQAFREEIPWPLMALVLVLGRLCDPSSELHLAEHSFVAGALSELLGVPVNKVNDDRLYRALDKLLPHKKALEKHLKEKLDLLQYDVTSTYFCLNESY